MATERVAWRQVGVVEVVGGIARKPELLHDADGAEICRGGEGDNLRQSEDVECVGEDGASAFSGEALAPMVCIEAPADFDAGGEVRVEGGNGEADIADELCSWEEFGGPEAEAVLYEVGFEAVNESIALFAVERSGVKLHNAGIGVDAGERRAVAGAPAAEKQACGFHGWYGTGFAGRDPGHGVSGRMS